MCIHIGRHKVSGLKYEPAQAFTFACIDLAELTNYRHLRVRFKVIGNAETMQESDLPTFLIIISSPIIFKRSCTSTRIAARAARLSQGAQAALPTLGGPSRSQDPSLQNWQGSRSRTRSSSRPSQCFRVRLQGASPSPATTYTGACTINRPLRTMHD